MELAPTDRACLNLFSGPGGTAYVEAAGWPSADFVEYDKYACQTLRANFPNGKVHECDIRSLMVREYSRSYYPVHLYTFPCDHYSEYANVHGAQTGDDLYLHCLRNNVLLWPEVLIIENVLGLRKFPVVMELWRNLPHYHTTELIVWGEDFTLMRKARVFLILHRQAFKFPSLEYFPRWYDVPFPALLTCPGRKLGDYLDDPSVPGPEMQPYIEKRLNGSHPSLSEKQYRDPPKLYIPSQETPINLPTNYKRDRGVALVADARYQCGYRPFSVREIARLHGFPDTHVFCGPMTSQYQQVLDSVMPPVAYALGVLLNQYFEAIEELLPQPKSLGYRYVLTERNRKMAPTDHLLHAPRRREQPRIVPAEPFPTNLVQPTLL
jgi:DNA (cytosine-5)-methyltransferase 1